MKPYNSETTKPWTEVHLYLGKTGPISNQHCAWEYDENQLKDDSKESKSSFIWKYEKTKSGFIWKYVLIIVECSEDKV